MNLDPTTNPNTVHGFRRTVVAIGLAGASVLAACGGDDGKNSNDGFPDLEVDSGISDGQTPPVTESATPTQEPESATSTSTSTTVEAVGDDETSRLQREFQEAMIGLLPSICKDIVGDGIIGVSLGEDGQIIPDANALHDYVGGVRSIETRQWADAPGPALAEKGASAKDEYLALKGRLCEDRNYTDGVSWFIANQLKIGDKTFAEFMPEVFGMYKDLSDVEIDELSERYYTLLNKKPEDTTEAERTELATLHAEHLQQAAAVVAALEVFNFGGVTMDSTSFHLALADGGFNRDTNPGEAVDLPGIQILNTKYNGRFLQFEAIGKDGTCYLVFLINTEDGRPAKSLKCAVVPVPTTTTQPRASTTTSPNTTSPTTTTPTTIPATTTTQPFDACLNIPGVQNVIPAGQELVFVNGVWICKDIQPTTPTTGNPAP